MNWLRRLLGGGSVIDGASKRPSIDALRVEWREGSYPLQAVGESNYQAALSKICGGHSRHGHDYACRALIIPEPTNAYDPNALKVVVEGHLVGYISRDQAVRLKEQTKLAGQPDAALEVAAIINGGWRTNQHDQGYFGVKLGIPNRGDLRFEHQ